MSSRKTAEKKASAMAARAARLRGRLRATEDPRAARAVRKRVKRAQRARRKALVEAAGGAIAQAQAKAEPKSS
jgi:hypothetical protein